jgi:hypothetical protein
MISIAILFPLYFISIQYERGGFWKLLLPVVVLALILDVLLNFTELALLTLDFPMQGEWTFSKRLSRLQHAPGARGEFAWYIARCLDSIAPSGKHIL